MDARRLISGSFASSCVICVILALTGATARAAVIHEYLSQITEVPASSGAPAPGPLTLMESMDFDSGHLWVAETFAGTTRSSRVDEFDARTGAFISQLAHSEGPAFYGGFSDGEGGGIAVRHAAGENEVYVQENVIQGSGIKERKIAVYGENTGTLNVTWNGADTPGGVFNANVDDIAVDNSTNPLDEAKGDVYVAIPSQHVIDVLRPEADGKEHYVGQITGISPSEDFDFPNKVAVNESNGDLVVLDVNNGTGTVDVFEPTALGGYTFVRKIAGPPPNGSFEGPYDLAVDSGDGDAYVTDEDAPGVVVVDQFGPTGTYLGRITGTGSPDNDLNDVYSVAIDSQSHDVYVGDSRESSSLDVFGPDIVIPDVTTGSPAGLKAKSATLTGTVDPDKAGPATCRFVWGTSPGFGHIAPCSAAVAEGEEPVPVEAELSGLEPDATYYYELQATDANGTNSGEPWQVQKLTTPGPRLDVAGVSAVTAESATLDATIVPHGAPVTAYFQYGVTNSYGADTPAPPGTPIGSGENGVEIEVHLQGLRADTDYHYRVVEIAELEAGHLEEFDGPDQTFTTQRSGGSVGLPDGRSWELVTPPSKEGALFLGLNYGFTSLAHPFVAEASATGNAIVDLASQATEPEPEGNANEVSVLSTRGPSGWSSQVLAPPHAVGSAPSVGNGGEYRFFAEDLAQGVVQEIGDFTPLAPEATEATPYLRSDYLKGQVGERCEGAACYRPLVTTANTAAGTSFGGEIEGHCFAVVCGPTFVAATPDASHVVMSSQVKLVAGTQIGASLNSIFLYEWSNGVLHPLDVLPQNEGGGQVAEQSISPVNHQLSDHGALVFPYGGHVYLQDPDKEVTVRLDVAQGATEPTTGEAHFLYASSNGSRILFEDAQQLTPAAGGGIYECRIVEPAGRPSGCELELTGLPGGRLIGGSQDASYVYFLTADGYLDVARYEGGKWTADRGPAIGTQIFSTEDPEYHRGDYRVSDNGLYLTFMSNESLTGYDTQDALSGEPDEEVYLYDAETNRLICASCDPTGARPLGVVSGNGYELVAGDFGADLTVAANLPPWTVAEDRNERYQPRFLSNSGRVFFDSKGALVPQDVNGTQDVYEYEPAGVGDCSASSATFSEHSEGCVGLISSGSSAEESAFIDASETGGDVFFLTQAKLVGQDFDTALDVYDAHECTDAVPCYPAPPATPPACATGDACKAAPSPQPSIFGPAPSATFSGAGNVIPAQGTPAVKPKSLTRAQRLTLALKACAKKARARRARCDANARKRYGPPRKSGKSKRKRKG